MTCEALCPTTGARCLVEGTHADHIAEHEGIDYVWPNEDFVPPARPGRRNTRDVVHRVAEQIPRQQAIARHSDPSTSHDAAVSVGDLRPHQQLVYAVLANSHEPLTDEDIYARLGEAMSVSGARTRRSELVDAGLVEDSGLRGITEANRATIRWQVSR